VSSDAWYNELESWLIPVRTEKNHGKAQANKSLDQGLNRYYLE